MNLENIQQNPLVIIIVINWNSPSYTIRCIQSLQKLEYDNYHVLVIDNGSSDDSLNIIAKAINDLDKFKVFETGDNLGFSGGVNYGITRALDMQAEYIWLLNNDTEVDTNCLGSLVKAMRENTDVAIAGSKILLSDERNTIWHAGATINKNGQPEHFGMGANIDDLTYSTNRLVDYVTGSSLLISRNSLETIGIMDDRFYLYYEEADLCYRARQKGFKIMYVAHSQLWHKVAASSTGHHVRVYYEVRNRLLFTHKHRSSQIIPVFTHLIIQELIKPLMSSQFKLSKYALLGFMDFLMSKYGRFTYNL